MGESDIDEYILGNKQAWEEAFDHRDALWGADIVKQVQSKDYAFLNQDTANILKTYDLRGKTIGQFCCNNGRELLSLVKSSKASKGIGFDIAENQVKFANEKAEELKLPCEFVQANILEIDESFYDCFDFVLITIGALCWFKELSEYFNVVSKCMKQGGIILINEEHPMTNMIASKDEPEYDDTHPMNCIYSYFDHEWVSNSGMYYMTGKTYESKTFTDYTHSLSDIIGSMCRNHLVITDMKEYNYDIADAFASIDHKGFPLSVIIEGRKEI